MTGTKYLVGIKNDYTLALSNNTAARTIDFFRGRDYSG